MLIPCDIGTNHHVAGVFCPSWPTSHGACNSVFGSVGATVSDAIDTVGRKVAAIFAELVGDRAERLNGSVIAEPAMSTIESALTEQYGEKAHDVAFHMADWNSDAAFVVAVHLFPERFTREEIAAGVGLFLVHAPNHIRAACGLTEQYVWENFPGDDEGYRAEPDAAPGRGGT